MTTKRKCILILGLLVMAAFVGGTCISGMAEESQGTWHKVGHDVKKTVNDVGAATKQTYEKTKEKSSETWQKTKKKSQEAYKTSKQESTGFWHSVKETVIGWYHSAKSSIHSATAPSEKKKKPEKPGGASPGAQ